MQAIDGSLIAQVLKDNSRFGGDYDGRLGPLTNWVNNNAHLFEGKTILDLGANAGHFPIEYVRAGARKVYAVEGRPEFFDQWREFSPLMPIDLSMVEWWTSDVRAFDFRPVDIVSCLGLLYHVEGFLPKLRELCRGAEMVLIEVQTGDEQPLTKREKPINRTLALKDEQVLIASPDLWEKMFHAQFHDEFNISRIWLISYGDVYKVRRRGRSGHEFALTMRSFYLMSNKTSDFRFMVDDRTGCVDITSQPMRVYDEPDPSVGPFEAVK